MFKNPSCISTEQQGNRDFRLEGVNLSVTSESEPEPFVFFFIVVSETFESVYKDEDG